LVKTSFWSRSDGCRGLRGGRCERTDWAVGAIARVSAAERLSDVAESDGASLVPAPPIRSLICCGNPVGGIGGGLPELVMLDFLVKTSSRNPWPLPCELLLLGERARIVG
jgi:hypothetical protein